ncbi:MAG TPA: ECF-type sigma factor [Gemmatirosa sp.]
MTASAAPSITQLLHDVRDAGADARPLAVDRLAAAVYDELYRVADAYLRRERTDHTLQPTALVHDAFLRLVEQRRAHWQNRTQFFAVAAEQMRRLLVDHARRTQAGKRAGQLVTLDPEQPGTAERTADVLRVDEALQALARVDPRQARIVELRFFTGLTIEETAAALGIAPVTVSREWAVARAWLYAELGDA